MTPGIQNKLEKEKGYKDICYALSIIEGAMPGRTDADGIAVLEDAVKKGIVDGRWQDPANCGFVKDPVALANLAKGQKTAKYVSVVKADQLNMQGVLRRSDSIVIGQNKKAGYGHFVLLSPGGPWDSLGERTGRYGYTLTDFRVIS